MANPELMATFVWRKASRIAIEGRLGLRLGIAGTWLSFFRRFLEEDDEYNRCLFRGNCLIYSGHRALGIDPSPAEIANVNHRWGSVHPGGVAPSFTRQEGSASLVIPFQRDPGFRRDRKRTLNFIRDANLTAALIRQFNRRVDCVRWIQTK